MTETSVWRTIGVPDPDIQSETHKTNPYSLLDNPTGISVKEGETLVVMVGDTHGQNIGMKVQNLDVPGGDGFGRSYVSVISRY